MRALAVWAGTFALHAAAQFFTWATFEVSGAFGTVAWHILSFPAFTVAGEAANDWFWPISLTNSVLWASALAAILGRKVDRSRDAPPAAPQSRGDPRS
jgi:hypothetical protein